MNLGSGPFGRAFGENGGKWKAAVSAYIPLIIIAIICLAWMWPFAAVPTGSRGVVTQFGHIVRIQPEGLTLLPPWQRLTLFSIRAEQADIDKADGSTADTQPVEISLTVRYSIIPDKVSEVFEKYSHSGNLDNYVNTATHEVFKAVTAKYTAPDLIAKRPQVSQDIYDALSTKLEKYGAQVINIDMRNFSFSPQYMAAINDKVTQEQLRLAAENKLKTVEAEQKQKVAIAEAEASAVRATADGQAYATKARAEADADAIKVKQSALVQGQQVLELTRIQVLQTQAERWDGKLPQNLYASAPMPIINPGK
jgi:prohibitin 2